MTFVWPASLPQCPLRGTQRNPQPNVISFGTEVGPGKVRRRSTARVNRLSVTFRLTRAELAIFEAFFQDDLLDGAEPFEWNDPNTQQTATWRFDPQGPYTLSERPSGKWDLSASLMRLP